MRIILTGASGLIGSRFEELMFEKHSLIPLSSNDVDLTNKSQVSNFLENKKADVIVHFAGKTNVDLCEEDKQVDLESLKLKEKDISKVDFDSIGVDVLKDKKTALAINFLGTKNIYDEAKLKNIKFIYISTDFVFEGSGKYSEESTPNPINWYGMTKWLGERLVDVSEDLIVRLSYPFGYQSSVKNDFVWKLISLLRSNNEVSLIEDQVITPTFIDDIVNGLDFLLSKNVGGIYHLGGSSYDTPNHIGEKLKAKFGFQTKISPTTRDKVYFGKAARPFQSIMKNDKIVRLGFKPKTFDEGLSLIKR